MNGLNQMKCCLAMGAAILLCSTAAAEIVQLSGGGKIEGAIALSDASIAVEIAGGKIVLPKDGVAKVTTPSEEMLWYEKWLPKVPHSARGHWIMAEECRKRRLNEQRDHHLEMVLQHDPLHEEARHALGYSKVKDQWVKTDEWNRSQGYVRYKGTWRTPQDVALEEAAREREIAEKKWKRHLKMVRSWIGKSRHHEAIAEFRGVKDWRAAAGLAEMLADKDEISEMKIIYAELLGRLATSTAVSALVEAALVDGDALVREKCLDQLERMQSKAAVQAFIRQLENKDNRVINRAAAALARMKDPAAVPPLIEALVTKHKFAVGKGGSGVGLGPISASFGGPSGGGGLGGLSAGGGTKIIEREMQNDRALDALIMITDGVNYRFDQDAWRNWYADEHTPRGVDLRRGG